MSGPSTFRNRSYECNCRRRNILCGNKKFSLSVERMRFEFLVSINQYLCLSSEPLPFLLPAPHLPPCYQCTQPSGKSSYK